MYFPKERILQLILSTEIEEKFRFNEMVHFILTFQKSTVHCVKLVFPKIQKIKITFMIPDFPLID